MTDANKRICLGAFAGAHGVRGDALVKTFTQTPENIAAYGTVESEDGKQHFTLTFLRAGKPGFAIVRAKEINNREEAMALKGVRLYVERNALPPPEDDEFYLEDLVGLEVIDEAGVTTGLVSAVHDFGAGDLIEIKNIPGIKGGRLLEFTRENFPSVTIGENRMTVRRAALDELDDSTKSAEPSIENGNDHNDARND